MNKYKRPLQFIWNSFKGHKKMFYLFFLGRTLEGIFYVVFPILAKLEMDQLVEKNEDLFGLIFLNDFNIFIIILLIIFSFKILENILKSFIELFQYDYIKIYDNYYYQALYSRLEHVDPGIFLNFRNKRFIGDILGNASIVGDWIRRFIGDMISNFFVIIGVVTVLAIINIWIFVVLLVSSFFIFFIENIRQKYLDSHDFDEKYNYNEKIWILSEQMGKNLTNLMSSGGFKNILSYYKKSSNELRINIKKTQKRVLVLNLLSFITENISEVFVKLIVGYSIFFLTTSIGTMTMVILYVGRMQSLFSFFRHIKFSINEFLDSLLKLDLFLDLTENTITKDKYIESINKIEFKGLSFSYPNFADNELKYFKIIEDRIKSYGRKSNDYDKEQLHLIEETKKEAKKENTLILNNINLTLETWKTYGLVGKNGAGKTTLIMLILNYFNSYEGSILIDNNELKDFKRDFFINNVSVINQVPYIIEGFSIRENLLLGVMKVYSDDYILGLLNKFGLKNKILKLIKGLDSKLGYDNDFSGGEKQLLVLIRIILQDKKILIMDEGTNQLDADNELIVMNELLKNKDNKIVIFISHRMTTIRKVDLIYCLENGTITDSGNHNDLLNRNNIYSTFWRKQVEE